jgi:hypothetical protein
MSNVALIFRLRTVWSEFFPDQAWPGDPAAALEYVAGEIRMLRETDVRPTNEIQKAHDLLTQLILDKPLLNLIVAPEHQAIIRANCDVLCWVLHHDHNKTFADNYERLIARMELLGLGVFRFSEMQNKPEKL